VKATSWEVLDAVLLEEKKPLSAEEIEAQTALELPEREMLDTFNQVGVLNIALAIDNACIQLATVDSTQTCRSGG
jgi:hypothetical protein